MGASLGNWVRKWQSLLAAVVATVTVAVGAELRLVRTQAEETLRIQHLEQKVSSLVSRDEFSHLQHMVAEIHKDVREVRSLLMGRIGSSREAATELAHETSNKRPSPQGEF